MTVFASWLFHLQQLFCSVALVTIYERNNSVWTCEWTPSIANHIKVKFYQVRTYKHTKRTHAGTYTHTRMHKTRPRLFSLNMIFVIILYMYVSLFSSWMNQWYLLFCYNNVHENGIKETKVWKKIVLPLLTQLMGLCKQV